MEEENLNIFYLSTLNVLNVLCQKNNNLLINKNRGFGGCFKSVNNYIRIFENVTIFDSVSNQKAIGIKLIDNDYEIIQGNSNESHNSKV